MYSASSEELFQRALAATITALCYFIDSRSFFHTHLIKQTNLWLFCSVKIIDKRQHIHINAGLICMVSR